jgi:hypothetical protein
MLCTDACLGRGARFSMASAALLLLLSAPELGFIFWYRQALSDATTSAVHSPPRALAPWAVDPSSPIAVDLAATW